MLKPQSYRGDGESLQGWGRGGGPEGGGSQTLYATGIFLRLLPKALVRFTFALEVGYEGNITQNFRKIVVKVPSVENISLFILCNNARAKR